MSFVWTLVSMTALCGVVSLGVDLARVHLVKTELQRTADACAHFGAANLGAMNDGTLRYYMTALASVNTAEGAAVTLSGSDIEFGVWNKTNNTFAAQGSSVGANAVRIWCRRTAARGNAVSLIWGRFVGKNSFDVTASSIAVLTPPQSMTTTINGNQADPWLAGMPAGSTASYNDTAPNHVPPQLTIPLVPGSYITFDNASGFVRHGPTQVDDGPDGNASKIRSHGSDAPGGATPGAENGIADVVMPIDAILGVFLGPDQPNATSAPNRRDYSTAAARDQASYDDIELKQPFFIGDGETSGGTTQRFKVPTGATRLFLGSMDSYEWGNNMGSFSITTYTPRSVSLVK